MQMVSQRNIFSYQMYQRIHIYLLITAVFQKSLTFSSNPLSTVTFGKLSNSWRLHISRRFVKKYSPNEFSSFRRRDQK